jgi:hypothetical protein
MMSNITLPKIFWEHVLETVALNINRVSSKSVEKTHMSYGLVRYKIYLILKFRIAKYLSNVRRLTNLDPKVTSAFS